MKPKKISKSEHRKRKRKKPESMEKNNGIDNEEDGMYAKERKRVNAKLRKMILILLMATISGSMVICNAIPLNSGSETEIMSVAGFNPRYIKMELGPGKDNTEKHQLVQEPSHRTEDLKFLHNDLEAKTVSNPGHWPCQTQTSRE